MGLFSPTKQTTTSTSEPWAVAQPYINNSLLRANSLYTNGSGRVPAPSWEANKWLQMTKGLALGGNPLMADTQNATRQLMTGTGVGGDTLTATARGDNLDAVNPYLQGQIDDQAEKIATQVRSLYGGMGRYGSATMNRDLVDRLGQFRGGILSQNWENERNRQMDAAGTLQGLKASGISLSGDVNAQRYADADAMAKAGAYQDAYRQMVADNPWQRLSNYANIVNSSTGGYGTQTNTQPGPSILSQILGGITGVGSLVGSLTGGRGLLLGR